MWAFLPDLYVAYEDCKRSKYILPQNTINCVPLLALGHTMGDKESHDFHQKKAPPP